MEFFKFSLENDMFRDCSKIPDTIQQHLRELTMMEEMLLSPVLPVMTVYRLLRSQEKDKMGTIDKNNQVNNFPALMNQRAAGKFRILCQCSMSAQDGTQLNLYVQR